MIANPNPQRGIRIADHQQTHLACTRAGSKTVQDETKNTDTTPRAHPTPHTLSQSGFQSDHENAATLSTYPPTTHPSARLELRQKTPPPL